MGPVRFSLVRLWRLVRLGYVGAASAGTPIQRDPPAGRGCPGRDRLSVDHLTQATRLTVVLALLTLSIGAAAPRADGQMAKMFDIPSGPAAWSLEKFTLQSGQDLLYSADAVSGVITNAVHGRFAAA